jgi:hypothetical protein
VVQTFPAQQPLGHDIGVHLQLPLTHVVPTGQATAVAQSGPQRSSSLARSWQAPAQHVAGAEHAAAPPQAQWPTAEQASADAGEHATHSAPSLPHVSKVGVVHSSSAQQPSGQESGVHRQAPLTHCVPVGQRTAVAQSGPQRSSSLARSWQAPAQHVAGAEHGDAPPHAHWPAAEQASAEAGEHATHSTPLLPHVSKVGVVHSSSAQQPSGQESGVHRQAPPAHCVPVGQRTAVAQSGPQRSSSLARSWQAPSQQVAAPVQAAEPPHVHWPSPEQASAVAWAQARHAVPPTPQCAKLEVTHVPSAQQPAQSVVQRHAPSTHCVPDAQATASAQVVPQWSSSLARS